MFSWKCTLLLLCEARDMSDELNPGLVWLFVSHLMVNRKRVWSEHDYDENGGKKPEL